MIIQPLYNTISRYANLRVLFTEDYKPLLAFLDETEFKNDELSHLFFIDYEINNPATKFIYDNRKYSIKGFINYHTRDNTYHHTELKLVIRDSNINIDENKKELFIYNPTININNCSINKVDEVVHSTFNYTLQTIKPNEVINKGIILNNETITHIISMEYIKDIDTINIIGIGDSFYDVKKIINVDEKDKFLVFYCNKVNSKTLLI